MGRRKKFSLEAISEMTDIVREHAVDQGHENGFRMIVTDEVMCSILEYYGYTVNVSYVERLRKVLGVAPKRGKFFDDKLAEIHNLIRQYTIKIQDKGEESWKMTISDKAMAEIICQAGEDVNAKYVERQRRSLGIKPSQDRVDKKVPYRPFKDKDVLTTLHDQDAFRLSTARNASCNMYGSAGLDTYSPGFGRHTTSYNEAISRKEKQLQRMQNKAAAQKAEPIIRIVSPGEGNVVEVAGTGCFTRGRGGAKRSAHDSMVYQSL